MSIPTTADRVRQCAVLARALRYGAAYGQVTSASQDKIRELDAILSTLALEQAA